MSTREDVTQRGAQKGDAAMARVADEIRQGRLALGKSQKVAAEQADISASSWSRIERNKAQTLDIRLAARMAAMVGLDLTVSLYRSDQVLRDAGHVRLLRDLTTLLGDAWTWRYEVPVATGEQRAWDAVGTHRDTRLRVRVEAETRIADCQAQLRRIEGKRETAPAGRLVVAIRDSRANRIATREADAILRAAFPADPRQALIALRQGLDPGRTHP